MTLTINTPRESTPPYLTHYTDLAGFAGIVSTGELWASNVSFLNDREELLFGLNSALIAARRLAKKESYARWSVALHAAVEALKNNAAPNTYAACFTKDEDALSQWRGYGGLVQGVALTFSQPELSALLESVKARLYKVTYGNIATPKVVDAQLRLELNELDELDDILGASTEEEKVTSAIAMISQLLPRFKHHGFADEHEHRYVVQHNKIREEVCFRISRNVIIPYLKLLGNAPLPLSRVKIGPGHDQELTRQSVQIYLRRHGYENVSVQLSSVPFRT